MVGLAVTLTTIAGGQVEARADKLADIMSNGVVRVVVFADFPPFGSQNAQRQQEGFDIDLANKVAAALGVKLELVPVPAASRIPYLLTDKADMNIAAMSITAERARQVMYSAPYADTSLAVYGPKDSDVANGLDLKDTVSVARGTTDELMLTAASPNASIIRTEDTATSVQAYLSGQAKFLAINSVVVPELKKKNPDKEFEMKFTLRRAPVHITIPMGEHNLLRWLNTFIFQATLSGELEELHQKWLGVSMSPLPPL